MSELKNVMKEIEFHQNFIGEGFLLPPEGNFSRVNIFGEVCKAEGFAEKTLYLFYEIDLPIGWKVDDENEYYEIYKQENFIEENINKLKTVSQKSQCTANENGELKHVFNLPIEVELLAHNYTLSKPWPKLLIQVNSVDSWGRHRIEGYSFCNIPNKSMFNRIKVPCYRPIEDISMKIFSFFLGGSRRIPDLKEIAKSYSVNENELPTSLNKYGIKTEFSGFVELNINVTIQRKDVSDQYKKIIKEKQGKIAYSLSSAVESRGLGNEEQDVKELFKKEKPKFANTLNTEAFDMVGRFQSG